jgi:hypothetical protein
MWTGLVWLRIGIGGELLWSRYWTFRFHEMLGNYLVPSISGLSGSVQLVSWLEERHERWLESNKNEFICPRFQISSLIILAEELFVCCNIVVPIIDLSDRKKCSKTLYMKMILATYVRMKRTFRRDCVLEIQCLNCISWLSIDMNQLELDVALAASITIWI